MVKNKLVNNDSLDSIFDDVDKIEQRTVDVDISQFLAGKQCTITLREPGIKEIYGLERTAKELRQKAAISGGDIPLELCQMITLLAACNVAPHSANPPDAYLRLSKNNWRAFQHIVSEFNKAFSYMANLDGAIAESKND